MRGRIRQLKPDLFLDDEFWALSAAHPDLPILQGFLGLWCQADREGRFEWRTAMLKTQILPYWQGDFGIILDALMSSGLVVRYEVDGRSYGAIRSFLRHQRPGNREPDSGIPAPLESPQADLSTLKHTQATRAGEPQSLPLPISQSKPQPAAADPPVFDRIETPTHRRVPKSWKPSDAFYGEALVAGVTREALDEDVTYWRARDLGAEFHDFEEFFRAHFSRLRKHRETQQFKAEQRPGSGSTGAASYTWAPTAEARDFAKSKDLDLAHAVDAYRAGGEPERLATLDAHLDFLRRLKCWAATGVFHSKGPLPKRAKEMIGERLSLAARKQAS